MADQTPAAAPAPAAAVQPKPQPATVTAAAVASTPATGADAKRAANQGGVTVTPQEGETLSDAMKRVLQEQGGDKLASATADSVESGAMMERTIKERIPLDHPAVDSEPRKGLPPQSNQIDFNDPRL